MKKHTGAYLEGCIASELNPGCRVGVGSKFACVLCQQPPAGVIHDVIVVRRYLGSSLRRTGVL